MTAATAERIGRALDTPSADVRIYLLYGPDESGSRALGQRLARAMGDEAERIDLTGAALKSDPALLVDEAAAISLFGGRRWIRIDPAGDEIVGAVDALLAAPAAGNPTLIIAGALRKDSKLVQHVTAHPAAMACASYPPEGRAADRIVMDIAHAAGLRASPDIAHRIAAATGTDRALIGREVEKLALFLDASAERPQELTHDALDLLSADSEESNIFQLADAVVGGALDMVVEQISRSDGLGIGEQRILINRLMALALLRSQVDAGETATRVIDKAGRALFRRDRERQAAAHHLQQWTSTGLATAIGRLASAERAYKSSGSTGELLIENEFIAIAREAARRR